MTDAPTAEEAIAIHKALWKQYRHAKKMSYFRCVAFNARVVPKWFFWPMGYVKFGNAFIPRNQLAAMIDVINERFAKLGRDIILSVDNFLNYERDIASVA